MISQNSGRVAYRAALPGAHRAVQSLWLRTHANSNRVSSTRSQRPSHDAARMNVGSSKRLIVTADDFGASVPINEAVELGHLNGILTGASLMIGGLAADDAVERARRLPQLGVGLHVTLVDGHPVLPPQQISELVGPDGRFLRSGFTVLRRLTFSARARAQAEAEIRAQLEAFRATGLTLDHVDGHQHLHVHPAVQKMLLRLAPAFGVRYIRVPGEPFGMTWEATRDRWLLRAANALFVRGRTEAMRRRLQGAGILCGDHVLGVVDSGHMRPERMKAFLRALPDGVSELYLHPATRRTAPPLDTLPPSYEAEAEYAALIDPTMRDALAESSARLTTFGELAKGTAA
jgi:chitin disaccharide deacetylase